MLRISLGSSIPKQGALAMAMAAVLATPAMAPAQSRSDGNNNSNSSARDRDRSSSRDNSSDENNASERSSQSMRQQSNRQQGHGSLGVVLYNDDSNALEIRRVLPDSAAEEAGLERGDEIISVNGRRVSSVDQLKRQLDRAGTDEELEIGILRDGRRQTVQANLSSRRGYASRGGNRSQRQWNEGAYGRNAQYGENEGFDGQGYGDEYGYQGNQGRSSRNSGYAQNYGSQNYGNQNYGNRGYNNQRYGNQRYGEEEYGNQYGGQNQRYTNRGQGYGGQNYGQYGNRSYTRGSRQTGNRQDEEDDRYSQGYRGSDRAFLGVTLDENARDRVRVSGVYPHSPAEEAGLRRGDEIVAIDDEDIQSNRDLQRLLSQKDPDDDVEITVERNGRERTLRAMLASQQEVFGSERGSYRTGRRNTYGQGYGDQDDYRDGYRNRRQQNRDEQDESDDDSSS
jgi:membrane-associated protease RseP (regulator of RpoE activity)